MSKKASTKRPARADIRKWEYERDLKRYEAAMKAKREHEKRFGPFRPKLYLVKSDARHDE